MALANDEERHAEASPDRQSSSSLNAASLVHKTSHLAENLRLFSRHSCSSDFTKLRTYICIIVRIANHRKLKLAQNQRKMIRIESSEHLRMPRKSNIKIFYVWLTKEQNVCGASTSALLLRKINFYMKKRKPHSSLWITTPFLWINLWINLWITRLTCGILFDFPQAVENLAKLSTSYPQGVGGSNSCWARLSKSYPQFPQPLL